MPNNRRRRFSVQHEIAGRHASKYQRFIQAKSPEPDPEVQMSANDLTQTKKSKNRIYPNKSRKISELDVVAESDSSSMSVIAAKVPVLSIATEYKDVTASSSKIELFNVLRSKDKCSADQSNEAITNQKELLHETRDGRQENRDLSRRDKHPRQHRVKVRSPKRRLSIPEGNSLSNDNYKTTVEINAIDWDQEVEVCVDHITDAVHVVGTAENYGTSAHSLDDMCRICHGGESFLELGQLISACSCRGTVGRVHVRCLERWLTESGKSRCELCGTRYETTRVHRYGVPRALVMWILSQNAKQLMVDSLGIILMSPLAVLAAWLSGTTLTGLMKQDSLVTPSPWPLASTFVLACMTLVCYYCWIVSAATRHALGWWIWYRSQYEVRLQLNENED